MIRYLLAAAILACSANGYSGSPLTPDAAPNLEEAWRTLKASLAQIPLKHRQGLPVGEPIEEGLDRVSLEKLLSDAQAARADAVVVLKNGKVVVEWRSEENQQPIHSRSLTKLITATAVGLLWDEGKLPSIDTPVHPYLTGWDTGDKAKVTIRHILTHTSGLQYIQGDSWAWRPDLVKFASELPLEHSPGTHTAYNNAAVMLLSAVVKGASGLPLDDYLTQKFFTPLGFTKWEWWKDEMGTPLGYAGVSLDPLDLAKFGQFWLQKGQWNDRRILSREFVELATRPANPLDPVWGLMWLIIGKDFSSKPPFDGFWMSGSGNQFLMIYPSKQLVFVQMVRRNRQSDYEREALNRFVWNIYQAYLSAR